MSTRMSNWTRARLTFVALLVVFPLATSSVVLGQSAQTPAALGPTMAISESGPVMGGSITLVWSAVPDATHYHVRVDDAVTLQVDDYYPAEAASCVTGGGVCTVTLATTGFTPGTGQWTVQAWSATAEGPWTEPKVFTYVEVNTYGTPDIGGAAGDTLTSGETSAAPTTEASASGLSDPGTLPATTLVVDSILGTPNQVIVTGTGVVTLSTPQDIDTSALFQVAGLGIGTPASSGNLKMAAGGKWLPDSDSTTALNVAQADGTDFVTFDTTNGRVGFGTTPSYTIHKAATISPASGPMYGELFTLTAAPAANTSAAHIGYRMSVETDTSSFDYTNVNAGLIGFAPRVFFNGTGTATESRGANVVTRNSGTGTITLATRRAV